MSNKAFIGEFKTLDDVRKFVEDSMGLPSDTEVKICNTTPETVKVELDQRIEGGQNQITPQDLANIIDERNEELLNDSYVTDENGEVMYSTAVRNSYHDIIYENGRNENMMSQNLKDYAYDMRRMNGIAAGIFGEYMQEAAYNLLEHMSHAIMNASLTTKEDTLVEMCRIVDESEKGCCGKCKK